MSASLEPLHLLLLAEDSGWATLLEQCLAHLPDVMPVITAPSKMVAALAVGTKPPTKAGAKSHRVVVTETVTERKRESAFLALL